MSGGAGTDTIIGSGSLMPDDMYLRKIEQTNYYESPTQLEDFHRATLKDLKPLPALFESDQIRGGRDANGNAMGNPYAKSFLHFRETGARMTAEPFLEEGSFTDWDYAEKDPRGTATGPDMRKHVDQQFARKDLIKFHSDADDSVPESGINPTLMRANIRGSQNVFKDYYKNFDTAFDSRVVSSAAAVIGDSRKTKFEDSSDIRDPLGKSSINKYAVTNTMSNDTSIGWRRTTDHKFQVSQYGKQNVGKSFTDENWYKNRANAHIDHDIVVSWQDTTMPKSMALLMMDLSKKKTTSHNIGLNNIDWSESMNGQNAKQKLTPADMAGMAARPTSESQSETAHAALNGDVTNKSGERLLIKDTTIMGKTNINTTIYESMPGVNKTMTQTQKDDLRNAIQQTATDSGLYQEETNKKKREAPSDPTILWESIALFKKGDSKSVKNYKAGKQSNDKHNKERIHKDVFERDSYTTDHRTQQLKSNVVHKKTITKDEVEYGNGNDMVGSQLVGGLGTKYMRKFMSSDSDFNDINDR